MNSTFTSPTFRQELFVLGKRETLIVSKDISSRLVTILKIIDDPIHVSDIFVLTVSFKFINISFQLFLLFFLKSLLASCLILFRLSTLFSFASCTQCNLACYLLSRKSKHSASNHGLRCFNSKRPNSL